MGALSVLRTPAPQAETEWLSPADVCKMLPGMTVDILAARRKKRLDPPFFKPTGSVVLYDRADIAAWVRAGRVTTRAGAE